MARYVVLGWALAALCVVVMGCPDKSRGSKRPAADTQPVPTTQAGQAAESSPVGVDEGPAHKLAETEKQIRLKPQDPMPYYRRAQYLMELGRYEEGYTAAHEAMGKFIAAGNDLTWMRLESIELAQHRVDVHYNMGPEERRSRKDGIVRPVSFRVWAKGEEPNLVLILDYEIGYLNGKAISAAFGQTTGHRHANYGEARPDMTYTEIREAGIALIKKMTSGGK